MKSFLFSIRFQLDTLIYIGIAECGYWQAAQTVTWRTVIGGIGVGLIAWKAKRSQGIESNSPISPAGSDQSRIS